MKNIKLSQQLVFSVVSFSGMAQTVSVTASTLDSAEAKLLLKQKKHKRHTKFSLRILVIECI